MAWPACRFRRTIIAHLIPGWQCDFVCSRLLRARTTTAPEDSLISPNDWIIAGFNWRRTADRTTEHPRTELLHNPQEATQDSVNGRRYLNPIELTRLQFLNRIQFVFRPLNAISPSGRSEDTFHCVKWWRRLYWGVCVLDLNLMIGY